MPREMLVLQNLSTRCPPASPLRQERTACHKERTSASQPARSLRGAVWPGRGIGCAERDEEGAGIRSESSEPQANGYSSEPRASEGFAKVAVGHGRLTRSGYTTPKRSNEQPYKEQPCSVAHPKALRRNSEKFVTASDGYATQKRSNETRADKAHSKVLSRKREQFVNGRRTQNKLGLTPFKKDFHAA